MSGRALDNMGKSMLCLSTPWEDVNGEFGASLPFVDDTISGLTTGQASALYYSLSKNLSKKEIASVILMAYIDNKINNLSGVGLLILRH